jgi:hypothetical protein
MDVPCPRSNSAVLQKVPLACEEVPYRCDKRAEFPGVLAGSGGPGAHVGASTMRGTRQTTLAAQGGGMVTRRLCRNTSAHLPSCETFVIQIPVARAASKSSLAARRENRVALGTFRTES